MTSSLQAWAEALLLRTADCKPSYILSGLGAQPAVLLRSLLEGSTETDSLAWVPQTEWFSAQRLLCLSPCNLACRSHVQSPQLTCTPTRKWSSIWCGNEWRHLQGGSGWLAAGVVERHDAGLVNAALKGQL